MAKRVKKASIGVAERGHKDGCVIRIGSGCVVVRSNDVIYLEDGTAKLKANAHIIRTFSYSAWNAPRAVTVPVSFKRRFDFEHDEARKFQNRPMAVAARIVTRGKENIGLSLEEMRRRDREARKARVKKRA
jgi:hypothetical protein